MRFLSLGFCFVLRCVDAARVISCGDCARAECDLDKFAANERFSRRKSQI
jgi:hypothetical protein